jgi:hypothetical protein
VSIIISNSPKSINDLLENLSKVVKNQQFELNAELAVVQQGVCNSPQPRNFATLIKDVDAVFWQFLGNDKLSDSSHEYLPGRLFTRLERIAEKKCEISLDEAQEVMDVFGTKMLARLREDIPHALIVKKGEAFQEQQAPFFHEVQAKLLSCAVHAANNCLGKSLIAVSDCESVAPANDADMTGFFPVKIHHVACRNFVSCKHEKLLEDGSLDRFWTVKSWHAFAYRKDSDGQWWKIDSLNKVNRFAYQLPVELSSEKQGWNLGEIRVPLSQEKLIEYFGEQLQLNLYTLEEIKTQLQANAQSSETEQSLINSIEKCLLACTSVPIYFLEQYFIESPSTLSFLQELQKDYKDTWSQAQIAHKAGDMLEDLCSNYKDMKIGKCF